MQVTITNMSNGKEEVKTFNKPEEARSYFINLCDEKGYDYDPLNQQFANRSAGGLGHDLRIKLNFFQKD
jgi:predicted DNA-binding WGR domain protein